MSLAIVNLEGKKVGEEKVPAELSPEKINQHVIWEVVTAELASRRQGTHKTKVKGEVSGGGAKPWRQKGTGRARAGSNRSPLWRGGGTVFGPQPRDYSHDIPKKKKLAGITNILAQKIQEQRLVILDGWKQDKPSTKTAFAGFEKAIHATSFAKDYAGKAKLRSNTNDKRRKITVIVKGDDKNQKMSVRNIPWIQLIHAERLSAVPLFQNHGLFITKEAFQAILEKIRK